MRICMLSCKSAVYWLFVLFVIASCNKRIVSSSGKVWYSPSDKQPFQDSVSGVKMDEFDNETFIKGGSGKNENFSSVKQTRADKNIENAVNSSFSSSQSSVLQMNEQKQNGQVDLTNNYINKNNSKKSSNGASEMQSGSIILGSNSNTSQCNVCQNNVVVSETKNQKKNEKVGEKISYKIQCGNYVNRQKAQDIAKDLKKNGISDVVVKDEGYTYKIFAGNYSNKDDGQDVFAKIKGLGYSDVFWVYR